LFEIARAYEVQSPMNALAIAKKWAGTAQPA
jgi:hypothetical protein